MLTLITLNDRPRELLVVTGLMHPEWARLLPVFATAYAALYPSDRPGRHEAPTVSRREESQRPLGTGGREAALPPSLSADASAANDARLTMQAEPTTGPLRNSSLVPRLAMCLRRS